MRFLDPNYMFSASILSSNFINEKGSNQKRGRREKLKIKRRSHPLKKKKYYRRANSMTH